MPPCKMPRCIIPGIIACVVVLQLHSIAKLALASAFLRCTPRRQPQVLQRRAAKGCAAERSHAGSVLQRLLGKGTDTFMDSVFGRKWMLSRWPTPRLTFSVQDCLDVLNGISPEAMKAAKMVKTLELAPGDYAFEKISGKKGVASKIAKFKHAHDFHDHGDGWTFTVMLGRGVNDEMQTLHHELWAHFGLPTGINAYLTPPKSQGLQIHTDPHDVFVLQQSGSKDWTLFEDDLRTKQCDIRLSPGDVLYLPAGVPHIAKSLPNESSLHLSVSVYRGDFTADAMLSALLEFNSTMGGFSALTEDLLRSISSLKYRLCSNDPWEPANQLLPRSLSFPLLRALDRHDLPPELATAASAELVQISRTFASRLDPKDAEASELSSRLQAQGELPEHELAERLLASLFAMREYHWIQFYETHEPKDMIDLEVGVPPLTPVTRLRRRLDANCMVSSEGALLINGHRISELPEVAMPAIQYCMGRYSGAAGAEFLLQDVPGPDSDRRAVINMLLRYQGLELLP
eukprot:TRINITY_DN18346_c0_g1_i1.p1 TRINITY_DN18346_c0_g1~~TRINITY_DN18346_c0_g1_i1.p1  ORF type:complete len:515 (+),score=92.17 TRINITY_DN18346_c0_g1_i1:130-1674(+)